LPTTLDAETAPPPWPAVLIPYRPGVLGVQKILELPQNCFGSDLAALLAEVDRFYNGDATIVADLTNDPTYTEPLFDMFGNRVLGLHIGPHGDGSTFEQRPVRNSAMTIYRVGRTYLFDRLLRDLRSNQIRLANDPMASRLFEQLALLEVERKANGEKIYKCPPGKHDDLAISCAMLNFLIRHPHWERWMRQIDAKHQSRPKRQGDPWKAFVGG
jgi:hypothetical protein